jgi:hypothetical protein
MRIDSSGNVGIGTVPASLLHLDQGSGGNGLRFERDSYDIMDIELSESGLRIRNETDGRTDVLIDGSGNVGIGTLPSTRLDVSSTASTIATFRVPSSGGANNKRLEVGTGGDRVIFKAYTDSDSSAAAIAFSNGATSEAMRITSDGNLLVGKTAASSATVGFEAKPTGFMAATRDGDTVAVLNRKSSDGEILSFRKDGSSVGSIGSASGNRIYIGTGNSTLGFSPVVDAVYPFSGDDAVDLGTSSARFDDVYATNGTIQTSDRNEKQDIAELTDAEQRVAVAAKGLLRKFRWKDKVAEKGDEARTHFGIIAQDLQAAFEAEGLDAGDYAMFISSTWTDEETGEERTRMGVRYSELLAFIIAAI